MNGTTFDPRLNPAVAQPQYQPAVGGNNDLNQQVNPALFAAVTQENQTLKQENNGLKNNYTKLVAALTKALEDKEISKEETQKIAELIGAQNQPKQNMLA